MEKVVVLSVLLASLAFGLAYAHNNGSAMRGFAGGGHMMGGGSGMMGLAMMRGYGGNGNGYVDPDRSSLSGNGWNSEVRRKYLEDTAGMRKELNTMRFEYMEARRNPASNADRFAALEKGMYELRREIQEKVEQYR